MADMLSSLGNLGSIVLQSMQKQASESFIDIILASLICHTKLNTMDQCLLRNAVADEKFRDMIQSTSSGTFVVTTTDGNPKITCHGSPLTLIFHSCSCNNHQCRDYFR